MEILKIPKIVRFDSKICIFFLQMYISYLFPLS